MNKSERTFSLPDSHLAVLDEEAAAMGMSADQTLAQAIRLYQTVNIKARQGLSLAFVDASGRVVADPVMGLPAFD